MSDLYMPDTPEGRAIEQLVGSLAYCAPRLKGQQKSVVMRLTRVCFEAMGTLCGFEETADHFAIMSAEAHRRKGLRHGRNRA